MSAAMYLPLSSASASASLISITRKGFSMRQRMDINVEAERSVAIQGNLTDTCIHSQYYHVICIEA